MRGRILVAILVFVLVAAGGWDCGRKESAAPPKVTVAPGPESGGAKAEEVAAETDAQVEDGVAIETVAEHYGLTAEEVAKVQAEQGFDAQDLLVAFFLADAASKGEATAEASDDRGRAARLARFWTSSGVAYADVKVIIGVVIRIGGWRSEGIGWGEVAHRLGVHPGTFNKERVWLEKHRSRDTDRDFSRVVIVVILGKWYKVGAPDVLVVVETGRSPIDVFVAAHLGSRTGKPWKDILKAKPNKPGGWVTLFAENKVPVKLPKAALEARKAKGGGPKEVGKPENGEGGPGVAGGGAEKGKAEPSTGRGAGSRQAKPQARPGASSGGEKGRSGAGPAGASAGGGAEKGKSGAGGASSAASSAGGKPAGPGQAAGNAQTTPSAGGQGQGAGGAGKSDQSGASKGNTKTGKGGT